MLRTSFLVSLLTAMLAADEAASSRGKSSRLAANAAIEVPIQPHSEKDQIASDARHYVFSELNSL